MKKRTLHLILLLAGNLFLGLLFSFSSPEENDGFLQHNAEQLSRGEGAGDDKYECVFQEGKCTINNFIHTGMVIKK